MIEGCIRVGDRLIWEPTNPRAWASITVVAIKAVFDDGSVCDQDGTFPPEEGCEHWITTINNRTGAVSVNEESRVREACVRDPNAVTA